MEPKQIIITFSPDNVHLMDRVWFVCTAINDSHEGAIEYALRWAQNDTEYGTLAGKYSVSVYTYGITAKVLEHCVYVRRIVHLATGLEIYVDRSQDYTHTNDDDDACPAYNDRENFHSDV